MRRLRLATFLALVALACIEGNSTSVPGQLRCAKPADGSTSYGCAVITGDVFGPTGVGLDGISGAVRATPQCGCRSVAIFVDTLGSFTLTVQRSEPPPSASPDTATIVVYMGATAPKYPRSITGDPFFDTVSVKLAYAPIGGVAQIYNLRLHIPLPAQ
jgi:hypothetical protein